MGQEDGRFRLFLLCVQMAWEDMREEQRREREERKRRAWDCRAMEREAEWSFLREFDDSLVEDSKKRLEKEV